MVFWHVFLWLALGSASLGLALAIRNRRVSKAAWGWFILAILLVLIARWAYLNGMVGQFSC
jgi:hypothetical protein